MSPSRATGAALFIAATLAGLPLPAAAQQKSVQCERDLFFADGSLRASRYKLNDAASGDQAARCAAWRSHEEAMRKAGAVYARCLSGEERAQKVAITGQEASAMASAIRAQCDGARPGPVERLRPRG